jgi:acyl-CoA reductase-like NAD-dependent aldehyde dehydrogenase
VLHLVLLVSDAWRFLLPSSSDAKEFLPRLVERASKLRVNGGFEPNRLVHFFCLLSHSRCSSRLVQGLVISPAVKECIIELVGSAEPEGEKILLDGRAITVEAYPDGNFVGPTVVEANTTMKCCNEEIFGPILIILHAKTLDEALKTLVNENKYDNGTAFSLNLTPLLGNSRGGQRGTGWNQLFYPSAIVNVPVELEQG